MAYRPGDPERVQTRYTIVFWDPASHEEEDSHLHMRQAICTREFLRSVFVTYVYAHALSCLSYLRGRYTSGGRALHFGWALTRTPRFWV